ncbi:hypothetical protein KQX54_009919 [Cotesia glomerata]|uniref:Uncharacterized protein n=1 Tax=Cotesia glomerata TaxID=32391 RepID=A0AAV7I9T4_COTGL|nr:hypothetical protein KQX54_009919 [Cotesia glomerata]
MRSEQPQEDEQVTALRRTTANSEAKEDSRMTVYSITIKLVDPLNPEILTKSVPLIPGITSSTLPPPPWETTANIHTPYSSQRITLLVRKGETHACIINADRSEVELLPHSSEPEIT